MANLVYIYALNGSQIAILGMMMSPHLAYAIYGDSRRIHTHTHTHTQVYCDVVPVTSYGHTGTHYALCSLKYLLIKLHYGYTALHEGQLDLVASKGRIPNC